MVSTLNNTIDKNLFDMRHSVSQELKFLVPLKNNS